MKTHRNEAECQVRKGGLMSPVVRVAPILLVAVWTPLAQAAERKSDEPEVMQCLKQHERSQELRQEGALLQSRAAALACASRRCPGLIRGDCLGWAGELDAEIPSLVFRVQVEGQLAETVEVLVDGKLVATNLDGRGVQLNPGVHEVQVKVPGYPLHREKVLLHQGERFRAVTADFPVAPPQPEGGVDVAGEKSSGSTAVYVLGGLAVAGAVGGAIWGVASKSTGNRCSPTCSSDRIEVAKRQALWADLSWGVGAASLIAATVAYWTSGEDEPASSAVDVAVLPGGALGTISFRLD